MRNTVQKYTKLNLKTSQGYIFHILQHFTTKLCDFTNFRMLFNPVVLNFPNFVQYAIGPYIISLSMANSDNALRMVAYKKRVIVECDYI